MTSDSLQPRYVLFHLLRLLGERAHMLVELKVAILRLDELVYECVDVRNPRVFLNFGETGREFA